MSSLSTGTLTYHKRAATVRSGKRDRYSLAEPKKQGVTCLIKHFQDILYNKKVVSKIMMGLKKLNIEKGPAGRYAVCKLASGHLVRLDLQVRRKAVGTTLSAKKKYHCSKVNLTLVNSSM